MKPIIATLRFMAGRVDTVPSCKPIHQLRWQTRSEEYPLQRVSTRSEGYRPFGLTNDETFRSKRWKTLNPNRLKLKPIIATLRFAADRVDTVPRCGAIHFLP
ncbi:hypothetical protein G3O08_09740 [Cryomorpha ignava]|uniref:Uncharacterized protein n=1 Tax=Cryomorpha ignava TaxID=101383 RepID=A0A7K3WSC9_9FLAO|nr:hypothetical protein [Cryomorpha ignava]NEN23782.1 hypothetical protein [Cryomorpha ignava]